MKTVKLLLLHGLDVNQPDASGQTALHLAISQKDLDMVKTLIESGAQCSVKDILQWTSQMNQANPPLSNIFSRNVCLMLLIE